MSRRKLLFGLPWTAGSDTPPPDRTESDNSQLVLSISRPAMACDFEISFDGNAFPQGTEAAMNALDEVERLESLLSVFRPNSRVQYINKVAAHDPVPLDDELYSLIEQSIEYSKETDGAIDITSAPLWKLWGFAKRNGHVPEPGEIEKTLEVVGFELIELDAEKRAIGFLKPGVEINFGCIGKGLATDKAAEIMLSAGVTDFVIHGGFSSVRAIGGETLIGIAHPMRPPNRLAEIRLKDRSLGTSGSQRQFFRYRGHRYGHIMNPKTGYPAEGTLMCTVVAPDAVTSDLLSTAFFVWGKDRSAKYCESHPDIAAIFVVPCEQSPGYEFADYGFTGETLHYIAKW